MFGLTTAHTTPAQPIATGTTTDAPDATDAHRQRTATPNARTRRSPRRTRPRPNATSTYPVEMWDAARVRQLREHLQWTQYEMAQRFHVRQQTISEWETGKYTPRGRSLVVLTALGRRYRFPAADFGSSPEPSATEPATALVLGADRADTAPATSVGDAAS